MKILVLRATGMLGHRLLVELARRYDVSGAILDLNEAVDVVLAAVNGANPGETYIPRVPAALIADVANCLIGDRQIKTVATGIRRGEKLLARLASSQR